MKKTKRNYAKGGLLSYLSPAYAASQGGVENVLSAFSPAYMIGKKLSKSGEKEPEVINMTKSKDFKVGDEFNTTGKFKKGGKVGKPRGCGAAQRGYGNAMKGTK